MKDNAGFTLIELLISLGIMSVLLSLGYANYRQYTQSQEITSFSRNVMADLRQAQEYASSGKKPIDPKCDSPRYLDAYSFKLTSATQYSIIAICSGGDVNVKGVNGSTGLTLQIVSSNPGSPINEIRFKPLGSGTNINPGEFAYVNIIQGTSLNKQTVTVGAGGDVALVVAKDED